jgi:hypothetical protein
LRAVLERGPNTASKSPLPDHATVAAFFPQVRQQPDELQRWLDLRRTIDVPRSGFSERDLKAWARTHPTSSGGTCGWTGGLLLQTIACDPRTGSQLAKLWARAPAEWLCLDASAVALRSTDGWLIPKGTTYRPIAAPQVMRRVGSGAAMRLARSVAERYCRSRGQFGLSRDDATLAYSLLPLLTSLSGGSVVLADRSMSYQTINRDAVLTAVRDVCAHATTAEQPAIAALLDAALEYFVVGDELPQTRVNFQHLDEQILVHSLAQGCTLSPTLEAVVIASMLARTPLHPAVPILAAHDDLVICLPPNAPIPTPLLPACGDIGGSYNLQKAIAFGPSAHHLVTAGAAAIEAPIATVWGRPIGSVPLWFETVWVPRFQTHLQRIRRLFSLDPAVAIWSLQAIRGPGALVTHVLRGVPPTLIESIRDYLVDADNQWVRLLLEFVGLPHVDSSAISSKVFGAALGHSSAAATAVAISTAGLATAFPALASTARAYGIDMRAWAQILDLPQLAHIADVQPSDAEIDGWAQLLRQRATAARDALEHHAPPASLWVGALSRHNPLHSATRAADAASMTTPVRGLVTRVALAHALGLPVWQLYHDQFPLARTVSTQCCGLCTAVPHVESPINRASMGTVRGTPCVVDAQALHVSACRRLPLAANNKARHNALVRVAAEVARLCDIDAGAHDGPIFTLGPQKKQRPADWIERGCELTADDQRRYPNGRCYDLTIRTGGPDILASAANAKYRKYAPSLLLHPLHAFSVFAINNYGEIGTDAETCLSRWSYHLARRQRATADVVTNTKDDVRKAFAYAFAYVMTSQVSAYLHELQQRSRRTPSAPPSRAMSVPADSQLARNRRMFSVHIRSSAPVAPTPTPGPCKRSRSCAPEAGGRVNAGSASDPSCISHCSSNRGSDDEVCPVSVSAGPALSAVCPPTRVFSSCDAAVHPPE